MTTEPGATRENPLYFQWVRDTDGSVNWGKILLMLGLTVVTAYLSVQTQRSASDPDLLRTWRMAFASKHITLGVKIQRAGKAMEEAGWSAYEAARP